MHTVRHLLLLGTVVQAAACGAGWRRPPELTSGPLRPRQQVQVWHQGTNVRWHGVVVGRDSISGIPFHQSLTCDSCRVEWPRAAVDSIRLGNPVGAFWKSVGVFMGGLLAVCVVICVSETT